MAARNLTQGELARALGVSDRTIRNWRKEGMPGVGEGRAAMYDEGACRAWCARHGKEVASPAAEVAPVPAQAAAVEAVAGPAPPPMSLPEPEPITPGAERAQAVNTRRRAWSAVERTMAIVDRRIRAGQLVPTAQTAEQLSRCARALTESVRGEDLAAVERSPRDLLVAALRLWREQWGLAQFEALVTEARS